MWLRDSTNQIQPYLRFMKQDDNLRMIVKYLVERQTRCVDIDFYANAFNKDHAWYSNSQDHSSEIINGQVSDRTQDTRLWERKWEIDSIAAHLKLICQYVSMTGDHSVLNATSLSKVMVELGKQQRGSYEDREQN